MKNTNCTVCRQPLDPQGRGVTTLTAGSLRLFRVHEGECRDIAVSGSRTLGYFAMHQGRKLLRHRFPMVSRLVEDYARLRRDERARLHD